ncbi:MAG: 3-keto-disaccharide hydrolase [Ginsengibacter sp.]
MKKNTLFITVILLTLIGCSSTTRTHGKKGWISLFDGKSLNGWKASEKPGTFSVEDGAIKVAGPRSHLFYEGPVMNHDFKNFEFKALVMTRPGSNSGVYFHTAYQEKGFPDKGFEVQVNNSHTDWKRTAGLYDIKDTRKVYVKDNVWFTLYIKVEGKHVITKINNTLVTDWTQPDGFVPPKGHPGRIIDHGTFALQGHNPESVIFFKDIMVKPLP